MDMQDALNKRKLVKDDSECPIYIWPKEQQIVSTTALIGELDMVEVHIKPDGDIHNQPLFCFVLETPTGHTLAAQISLSKIWPAIEAAIKAKGYEA